MKDGNSTLVENTDYTIEYTNNINIGNASILVSGNGNYIGNITKTFAITVKKGSLYTVDQYEYKVTNADTSGQGTVTLIAPNKKTLSKVKIASTVTIGEKKFKITEVNQKAFRNNKKLKSVVIGENVTKIGDNAFAGCKVLKSVEIGKNVTQIGKSAFSGDKKLKKIQVKTTKLKKIGKNAFKNIHAKAIIKVPKKKVKAYKKLFKNKGQKKTVVIKK